MAYTYYQQAGQPGAWGTSQYQFGPPPAPTFQPQATWGGLDFYRAHAPNYDPTLFNHALDRVRQLDFTHGAELGVGVHEARHWHRRAYGGMNELGIMGPPEIGHAAAYEAYRTWTHNRSMHEPLGYDLERQREALIGLAVAEATRLLSYSNRGMDQFARTTATEAAAATASYIFYQRRQDDEYHRQRRGRSRSRYDDWDDDDPYRYDDEMDYGYSRGGRSRSRHHRSMSRPRSYSDPYSPPYDASPYPGPMGVGQSMPPGPSPYPPSTPYSAAPYSATGPYPPTTPYTPSYANSYGGAGGGMISAPPMGATYSTPGYYPNTGAYPGQITGYGTPYPPGSATLNIPTAPMGQAMSTSSGYSSYGAAPYMGTAMSSGSMGGMPVSGAPGQVVVYTKSRHKHRHHRSRSRASD